MTTYPLDLQDNDQTMGVIAEPLDVSADVEALARRPYRMVVWHDDENGWAATIPDLPGLSAAGDTLEEMVTIVEDAKRLWIAAALADGKPVPEPSDVRVPTR